MASDIAKRLRELRDIAGLTQAEVAEAAGRRWQAVSEWERGKRPPSWTALERLSARFGWPMPVFLEGGPVPSAVVNRPVTPTADAGLTRGLYRSWRVSEGRPARPAYGDDLAGKSLDQLLEMLEGYLWGATQKDDPRARELMNAVRTAAEREKAKPKEGEP